MPFIYLPQLESIDKYEEISPVRDRIDSLKTRFDFLFLSHCKQYWQDHGKGVTDELSNKGNDLLIKGFAEYLRHSIKNSCLILLEYGPDVKESKNLIKQLNISDKVFWFPILPRKDIMVLIKNSNLICNEFRNSWMTGGVIFEALSLGKPLMGYRDDELYTKIKGNPPLYPMINVRNKDEIASAFIDYENKVDLYNSMGLEGKAWYQENIVDKCLTFFDNYLKRDKEIPTEISS